MVDVDKAVIARLKSHGHDFEILVDCDKALELRSGKDVALADVLAAEKIFSDAKKGLLASEIALKQVFGTDDASEAALQIIRKGEIQITAEHRASILEQKRKKILEIIRRNGIDPKTKLPHPLTRLELAFEEAKVRIDEYKPADQQVDEIMKKLKPILPISFEKKQVAIKIPGDLAGKSYSAVQGFGKLIREDWQTDGSWVCVLEVPAGIVGDVMDRLGDLTHGKADVKVLDKKV